MSGPIRCPICGDIIGTKGDTYEALAAVLMAHGQPPPDFRRSSEPCPGLGKHTPPLETRSSRFFDWVVRVRRFYTETQTWSEWFEYQGPSDRLSLWLAIHLGARTTKLRPALSFFGNLGLVPRDGTEGVMVSGEWVWPEGWFGLFGDGLEKLNAQAS